ncbi:Prenyltransferase and squalene oxidase repeat protein [Rubripirellula lacrimiformis]|uniref:Prenyltransferase and squalene oxidase repeat protein n=1 Tax=Rubripirellula lacrimiformis TaxID=1930273 RepID=A0A517NDN7_9BACT|nr:prenyltransferase/squalene oxidase repeat-containing protein [Rubripirellula lacrimiformis]QDT05239.1 Prenyltransferase and squalene oxidase repeat protein [Rubripirellula lacrimiformis]
MSHADVHRDSNSNHTLGASSLPDPAIPRNGETDPPAIVPPTPTQPPTANAAAGQPPVDAAPLVPPANRGPVAPPPTSPSPAPPPASIPPAAIPPAVAAPQRPPVASSPPPAATGRGSVVPPPPPPRATLPPVRPPADPKVGTGVGSARGVRWRGEIDSIGKPAAQPTAKTTAGPVPAGDPAAAANGDAESLTDPGEDRVRFVIPPWLVSLVVHLIFLLILALITTPAGSGIGRLILTIGTGQSEPSVELTEFEIATDDSLVESEAMMDSEIETEIDLDLKNVFEIADTSMVPELTQVDFGEGSSEISPPMFSGRTGAMKQSLLAMYGGTAETQDAVKRGLQWLKRNQRPQGGWSLRGPYRDGNHSENEASATAMAMLAFLGDGHTHQSGDYTDEMEKAVKRLVSLQDRRGFMAKDARSHEQMYAQAQATIALCEMYGMTRDSWLRPRAELAVAFAESAQSAQGGWRYNPNEDSDTSVTGWFLLALKSAQSAGLEVSDSKLRAVGEYLDTAQAYEGAAYSYQPRGQPTPAMTAEGLLCRQYLGWNRDDLPMVRGVEALSIDFPFDTNDQDVYYWYYATQVLHHFGGSPWREWNEVMRTELPKMQSKSGREDGSWAPQGDAYGSYGRLYTTCLSLYCLEVYYRHLPLYQSTE